MAVLPTRPGEVTAEWLEAAMKSWGSLPAGSVLSVDVDAAELEAGFFGDVARLKVEYRDAPQGAPAAMIAKFPSLDAGAVTIGKERGYYEREVIFYRDFAPSCGLRVPLCYGAEYDAEGGGNVLLLEDLSKHRAGSYLDRSWPKDARGMMGQLGTFHASWWGRDADLDFPWLPSTNAGAERFQTAFASAWPIMVDWVGGGILPEALEAGDAVVGRVAEIKTRLAQPPSVFLHADLRNENLFFLDDDPAGVAVLDWQHCRRGRAACDVASYLFGAGHRLTAEEEIGLVEQYFGALTGAGVKDYAWDDCWRDYRLSMVDRFVTVGSTFATVEPGTENGQKAVRYLSECTMPVFLRHARVLESL